MRELIEANGGAYSKNLTRQNTHLVSPIGEGRKVEGALRWKQFLVDPLWLEDCLKRKARVNEKYYSLSLPRHKRGKGAFRGLPDPNDPLLPPNYYGDPKSASSQKVIIARNKKNSDVVWASVIDALPKARPKETPIAASAWDAAEEPDIVDVEAKLKRTPGELRTSAVKRIRLETKGSNINNFEIPKEMFEDLTFAFCGYEDKQSRYLTQIVRSHKGRSSNGIHHPEVTHVIINSTMLPAEKKKLTKGLSEKVVVATEWMIERSMFEKKLVNDFWGQYVEHRMIPDFSDLQISISGFTGVDLLHVGKLIPMLGATLYPTLTPQRHVLVATPNSKKFKYALQWKIPIVRVEWLWECAKTGRSVPLTAEWTLDQVDHKGKVLIGHERESTKIITRSANVEKAQLSRVEVKQNSFNSDASHRVALLADKIAKSRGQSEIEIKSVVESNLVSAASTFSHADREDELQGSLLQKSTMDVPGTQITFCDPETMREREALLHAMGSNSDMALSQGYQFSQETQPAEDAFQHRVLRHQR